MEKDIGMVGMKAKAKKAMLIGELVIIVVVVLTFILVIFVGELRAGFEGTDRDICKSSVSAQATVMNAPYGEGLLQTKCKTYNVVFSDDRVEINGKRQSVYDANQNAVVTKFDSLTNDIVNQVVAEELRWCWYQYLEGKKFILDRHDWVAILSTSQKRLCVLCDEISFDSDIAQPQFTGFYDYTKTHEMSSSSMTYYSYYAEGSTICTDYSPTPINCWESYFADQITKKYPSMTPQNTPSFNKDEKYVVVFIMRGLKSAKVDVLSESDVDFFSYVLPSKELPNQCDSLRRGSPS